MDIAEKRVPQDGGFSEVYKGSTVNFRVSSFPAIAGERIVMRILMHMGAMDLQALGMEEFMAQEIRGMVERPHGMLLVTGPTGSGKTSTLYSIIRHLESPQVNIMTLEDPVEYRFTYVTQGQTNPKAGFTFASGLRSILRQDPDIIMVGEMRDKETADTAFKAALTGHLVLSSIHTSSAVETVVRLIDMGLERFVVASALRGLIGQRLVRKLCLNCRKEVPLEDVEREIIQAGPEQTTTFKECGCHLCNFTGYSGRTGIFELLAVDEDFSSLIKDEHTTRRDLEAEMKRRSLITIQESGLKLVKMGITSMEEVIRCS